MWVRKIALREALAGRYAHSTIALARIGGRRLGPYEVLTGQKGQHDYLLLRGATAEAAAGLPPPPDAAEFAAAAAAAADESARHAAAPPQPGLMAAAAPSGHLPTVLPPSASYLPPAIASALAALPPPAPGDLSPAERRTLLRGSLLGSALPLQAPRVAGKGWEGKEPVIRCFVEGAGVLLSLLRVRPAPLSAPPPPPAAPSPAL